MNELPLQYLTFGNMIALAISSLFYGLGGMQFGRIMRRFISPLVIFLAIVATSLFLHKFSYLILIVLPLGIGKNCLGYSSDHGIAWVKRAGIVALSLLQGVVLSFAFGGGWWLLIVLGLVASGTILFAWKNPVVARAEETLICILLNGVLLFYPFIT